MITHLVAVIFVHHPTTFKKNKIKACKYEVAIWIHGGYTAEGYVIRLGDEIYFQYFKHACSYFWGKTLGRGAHPPSPSPCYDTERHQNDCPLQGPRQHGN